uniref:UvrD-like helicase, ATP-binding domain, P-loop containing nucleoside triphosphate hydrolase n=1 Tax=Tanacetum cinerariifolium TaxID=118510 RepID=A0A6L2JL00_TANCI|nr:UvrD-like helicase, ATP-binding domain, P-loop containing nucleoside triphosphate hydrolase [Tanacetum cinerariifolium]
MLYDVTVGPWKNQNSERGKDDYHTISGDLLILVDGKPGTISDLQHLERTWAFSMVIYNEDDSTSMKVKASKPIEFQDGMFVIFVINLSTQKRIWNSLHMHRNLDIIKEVLYSDFKVKECNICHFGYESMVSKKLDPHLLLNLNESQTKAVITMLCRIQCCHTSSIEQIWGPPGTGKTMTVSVLLFILLQMKQKALTCTPTNVAIVQLASRVLSLVRESYKFTTASGDYFSSVRDLLLFGNNELLKVSIDIEEIYLEHRIERLAECLGPVTGWKHCIRSMIDLLENYVSGYYSFIENEFLKNSPLSNENEGRRTMLEIKSFIEFVQGRFTSFAPPLRSLSSLEYMLFQKNLVSEELEDLFNSKPLQDDFVKSCLYLLKTLQISLEGLTLPCFSNKYAIKQFCHERASVIFCTTSNSYKFLVAYVELPPFVLLIVSSMEPLNIMVIDEAAQLKEAESTIPLQLSGMKHAILVGDERQLPAMVNNNDSKKKLTVGVISPYVSQVVMIQQKLAHKYKNLDGFSVKVKSIDGFQGGEEDIIILSTMTIIKAKKELEQLDDLVNGNSVLFKHAKWKVLFSADFKRSFGKLTGSRLKKLVLNLLLKLSGGWRPKNISVDLCCGNSSQILKQFKVDGFYVICTIDIIKEASYVQVLKVWDILALDEILKLTKRLENIFSAYTDAFISRCAEKCLEGNLEVPMTWPTSQEIIRFRYLSDSENESKGSTNPGDARRIVENLKVSESLLLMKFYSLSRGVVRHLLSGKELDLPMQVTDEQMDIIMSPKTSFIIGRSGMGKTTILTMKLFQYEQNFHIASEGIYEGESIQYRGAEVADDHQDDKMSVLRQLFVTVSPKLCYAVKQNVSHLTSVSSIGNSSAEINLDDMDVITSEFSDIPDTFTNIPVVKYPLVITFQKFVMMLDGTLGNSFFERFRDARERSHDSIKTMKKMKTRRGEFDLGDVVNDIHHRLKNGNYDGDKMDLVYIDEVQDLSMRQISLFKYICQNVDEGFIFAGDTAQTIARGIDFRFQDIRSLFYKEFLSTKESGKHEKVDKLEPEISLISGEASVLLECDSDENAIVTIFGDTGTSGRIVGFGADQVILVRDDFAKTEICESVGKNALVLTILECKGLEFQDVLLYNFFGTSPLDDQWRVIHEYMKKHDWLDEKLPRSFPTFSEERHSVLCSELKQLYVAITRTRQRLWICENKEELSKPMFDYWKMRGLVQIRKLDNSVAQSMRVASTPQEWRERGKKFFYENNFVMATLCFERAGDTTWENLAKASGLRASADQIRGTNHEAFVGYVREAAGIFESIRKFESAASCYCDLGEFERAGKLYLYKCGKIDAAAECFTLSGCHSEAVEAYAKGDQFANCLCKEVREIEQEFLENGALEYHENKDHKSMMKFVRAFCSIESKHAFLRSLGCLDDLLSLEEESGHFLEAAELVRSWGDVIKEAELLEKAGHFKEAAVLLLWYVFFRSLWGNGNRGWPLKQFDQKEELWNRVKLVAKLDSDILYDFVCNELNILSDQQSSLTELKSNLDVSKENKRLRGEVLSIRKILDVHLDLILSKYEWEDELPVDLNKHCEEMMFQNRVSVRSLTFYLNIWKENVVHIFESLGIFHNEEPDKHEGHFDFSLIYLGVRKQGVHRDGELLTIDERELVFAIRSYWQSELVSAGIKVLKTLARLYHKLNPDELAFHRSTSLLHIFEVTKSLLDCQHLNLTSHSKKKLQSFLEISRNYFNLVFPLDWRDSVYEDLISLRETDLSVNLLNDIIFEYGDIKGDPSYWAIGRAMMICFSCRQPLVLFEIVMRVLQEEPLWKTCFEKYWNNGKKVTFVVRELQQALDDTFTPKCKCPGHIAPHSFMYLLDHLLFFASLSSDIIFTSKYSLVGWLTPFDSAGTLNTSLPVSKQTIPDDTVRFIVKIAKEIFYNKDKTAAWIKKSKVCCTHYPPILALKLMMILSLVCLQVCDGSKVLLDLLLDGDNVAKLLPNKFVSDLLRRRDGDCLNLNPEVVSEAFLSVEDPLLIVSSGDVSPLINAPCAIFVDLMKSKEEIMSELFPPKNVPSVQNHHSDGRGTSPEATCSTMSQESNDGKIVVSDKKTDEDDSQVKVVLTNESCGCNTQEAKNKKGTGNNKKIKRGKG